MCWARLTGRSVGLILVQELNPKFHTVDVVVTEFECKVLTEPLTYAALTHSIHILCMVLLRWCCHFDKAYKVWRALEGGLSVEVCPMCCSDRSYRGCVVS